MDLYKQLNLNPILSEPDIWISRLVIFSQITPNPIVIRDIPLTRGLNIIWAKEVEDETQPVAITGHSAGKTTFCRLLRYVLGEKTFGTKISMELIHKAFPEGYVAAEIHVRGVKWAVRRPLGGGRMSYGMQDVGIEEMLQKHGRMMSQESYIKEIGLESLLDEFETCEVIRTGEVIQWGHILAWCTRDQESRFQNIHEWRSSRSESDTPSFRFPKAGPLFVMRAALGLFLPDELKGEKQLSDLQQKKDKLTEELEEKRNEPQFRVNLYEYQLRQHLKGIFPNEIDIDSRPFNSGVLIPDDLDRLTMKAINKVEANIKKLEQENTSVQFQIDDLGAEIRRFENELSELDTLFDIDTAASNELKSESAMREEQRKRLEENKDKKCPLGYIPFRECNYIKNRQHILSLTKLQDIKSIEQDRNNYDMECVRINEEKDRIRKAIENFNQERENVIGERNNIYSSIREHQKLLSDLSSIRDELIIWLQKRDYSGGYSEIDSVHQKLQNTEGNITKIEEELHVLLQKHNNNRELLTSIFSGAIQSVLPSGGYNGEVNVDNREIQFRITHGGAMTGEAVETLSVLLADISCLVYNSIMKTTHLPGFLLHDSPREADLGLRLYYGFIRLIAELQGHFGSSNACPFQYVITTTTPPPPELNTDYNVKLRLNAAITSELLLRKNVAEPEEDIGLFNLDNMGNSI